MVTIVQTNELYHHGILGQKWGIRRYQNEDGSLTDEGKKRYGVAVKFDKETKSEYRKDKKKLHELKRNVAAENRNLIYRSKLNNDIERGRKKAELDYSRALSTPYYVNISKGHTKADKAQKTYKEYSKAADRMHQEVLRAERTNKAASDEYAKHVATMIDKYGTKRVKDVQYKTVQIGKSYVNKVVDAYYKTSQFGNTYQHDLIKTGFTKSYMPFIGRHEVAKRVIANDIDDRKNKRDISLSEKYR